MRGPCAKCGSYGVWTRLSAVKHERKKIVDQWLCTMCNQAWTTETARPDPPRAKLPGAAAGTHKPKRKRHAQ